MEITPETHLKQKDPESIFSMPIFQTFRRDRLGRRRGGVAIFAQGGNQEFELLWVKMEVQGKVVLAGALYHPPRPTYQVGCLMKYN